MGDDDFTEEEKLFLALKHERDRCDATGEKFVNPYDNVEDTVDDEDTPGDEDVS